MTNNCTLNELQHSPETKEINNYRKKVEVSSKKSEKQLEYFVKIWKNSIQTKTVQKVMRILGIYGHKAFKVVTPHSGM